MALLLVANTFKEAINMLHLKYSNRNQNAEFLLEFFGLLEDFFEGNIEWSVSNLELCTIYNGDYPGSKSQTKPEVAWDFQTKVDRRGSVTTKFEVLKDVLMDTRLIETIEISGKEVLSNGTTIEVFNISILDASLIAVKTSSLKLIQEVEDKYSEFMGSF